MTDPKAPDIKEQAALNSVFASAGLAVAKFVAAFITGSLGLLSDALHALLDVGATVMTYFAVRISGKPADDRHHYGHGKIEAVAALIETGLLFVVAAYVCFEALLRLSRGHSELTPSWIAYAVLIVSIVVDVFRSRALLKIAEETNSHALAADALHFSSDLVSSALVLVGLVATQFGYPQGDALAAIGVAVFIAVAGYRLGHRTIDTLMDAAPEGLTDELRQTIDGVRGVVGVERMRLRPDGAGVLAEVEIAVARTLPHERVRQIKAAVLEAIAAKQPDTQVTLSTVPRALDDETVLERVLHVAANLRRPVHHVTVQHIGERLSVSLDLEIDGTRPLSEGHAIASELEGAIVEELGPGVEVETHIEPLDVQGLTGIDIGADETDAIRRALAARAAETGVVSEVHNVRARRTSAGLVVNYHCRVAPEMTIAVMHNHVDAIEHAVRQDIPAIVRVVGHAEPLREAASAAAS